MLFVYCILDNFSYLTVMLWVAHHKCLFVEVYVFSNKFLSLFAGFDIGDYDLGEFDHLQHFQTLSNAPLMDLSGYDD